MKLIVPDYYPTFRCIADRCRHSCCIGWEIDIDDETADFYKTVPGEFGKRLSENITEQDGVSCFQLTTDERCPFLNESGLCDIILTIGEDKLCGICTDHPRFRNYFEDRTEIGLGLCCEAAGKLILEKKEKTALIVLEDDGDNIALSEKEAEFFTLRDQIFSVLQNRSFDIDKRIANMLKICGTSLSPKKRTEWADIFMSLECLDPKRDALLSELKATDESDLILPNSDSWDIAFEQLAVYFIYRHLAGALDDLRICERAAFAALSVKMIRDLCAVQYHKNRSLTVEDIVEISRIYSSEIEYSEENTEILLDILGE